MPDPRDVFADPAGHWTFLTADEDSQFEGQHFDRKEVPGHNSGGISNNQLSSLRDQVRECISAFANENRLGGLLVIGISKAGVVTGIDHLSDVQRTSLTGFNNMLVNQAAQAKEYDHIAENGAVCKICLIYVPYMESAICHFIGADEKAYVRHGAQNIPLTQARREQLVQEKGIRSFEEQVCCPYDPHGLEQSVVDEFRRVFLADATGEYSDEELLYQAGALVKQNGDYCFTNAGLLFFAANPQRLLPTARVRLLRYESDLESGRSVGSDTLDKEFTGPLTTQIRNLRTFFQGSGFFKTYQRRNPEGGFIEEPEYPLVTVDEAIVNALVHRDYSISNPVTCEKFRNALVVRNPGRLLQQERDVPPEFALDAFVLDSVPRNPKVMQWLKLMRDERGNAFVRQLSEGTKRMCQEMAQLGLPAPKYDVTAASTQVTLVSNAPQREALLKAGMEPDIPEFANLFALTITAEDGVRRGTIDTDFERRAVMDCLQNALRNHKWFIHRNAYGRLVARPSGSEVALPQEVRRLVRLFPAYVFQLRSYFGQLYLVVDYTLELHNACSAQHLQAIPDLGTLPGRMALARCGGRSERGRIISLDAQWAKVYVLSSESEVQVPSSEVWPEIPKDWVAHVLRHEGVQFDLDAAIKLNSLSSQRGAARVRAERVQAVVDKLTSDVFPIAAVGTRVGLQPQPLPLTRYANGAGGFTLHSLPEPSVEFKQQRESQNIRDGITSFGSYDNDPRTIELVPVCPEGMRERMAALIERLKVGKFKYRGAERTFAARLTYQSVVTTQSDKEIPSECERLLQEHPEWCKGEQLDHLFLVCTPEKGYESDDEGSPYFRAKRLLLEGGIPCQMVDAPTLADPDYKDLNLALNIAAKCGIAPWVFPDAIPDADFFVGLSYTENRQRGSERLMGYANVFNAYGRWEFYSGNMEPFLYEERGQRFRELVKSTLEKLELPESPSIYFHYSAKFSREDRDAILEACRRVRPAGRYTFVWVNHHHHVRLYDKRPETDGSLARGSYVQTSPNQVYISTTGFNPYRKAMGTPKPLEVNIWVEENRDRPKPVPDMKALATQILALTKLNWASTDSLCAEPITVKYAHDIAYLTSAFVRQGASFRLHPRLERTPWFI